MTRRPKDDDENEGEKERCRDDGEWPDASSRRLPRGRADELPLEEHRQEQERNDQVNAGRDPPIVTGANEFLGQAGDERAHVGRERRRGSSEANM